MSIWFTSIPITVIRNLLEAWKSPPTKAPMHEKNNSKNHKVIKPLIESPFSILHTIPLRQKDNKKCQDANSSSPFQNSEKKQNEKLFYFILFNTKSQNLRESSSAQLRNKTRMRENPKSNSPELIFHYREAIKNQNSKLSHKRRFPESPFFRNRYFRNTRRKRNSTNPSFRTAITHKDNRRRKTKTKIEPENRIEAGGREIGAARQRKKGRT